MEANDRSLAGFTMLAHGIFHSYELAIPIFVVVWLDVFQVSEAMLGLVVGAGYAVIGVGALPSGILADRFDSKRLIVISIAGMGVGFFLLGLVPNVYLLAVGVLLWGLAASIYHPVGLALISRGASDKGMVFAYHGVGGNVGTVLGPLIAVLLLVFVEWRYAVLVLAAPAFVVAALGNRIDFDETLVNGDEVSEKSRTTAEFATDGDSVDERTDSGGSGVRIAPLLAESRRLFTVGFVIVFLVVLLYGTYYRGLLTFLPSVLENLDTFEPVVVFDRTVEPARYVYIGLLTVGILGQYVGGRVTGLIRVEYVLLGTLLPLALLSFAFLPAAVLGPYPFILVCGVLGFVLYTVGPVYQVAISKYAASDIRGLSYGFTYLGMFGMGAVGSVVAGSLLTYFEPTTLFSSLGAILLLAVVLVVALLFSRSGDSLTAE